MAVQLYEAIGRDLNVDREGGDFAAAYIAIGSTNETEVYAAALQFTPLSFFSLVRSGVSVAERGFGIWDVDVTYSPIPLNEGLGAADTPAPPDPGTQPPASPTAPLTNGYQFSTTGGTVRIYQALSTVSTSVLAPFDPPDFGNAIGVTKDGVEGVDAVIPGGEFSREVQRAEVSTNYLRTITGMVGTVNNGQFYYWQPGEVLYLGAEGGFTAGERWRITHRFATALNRVNIVISPAITVPAKEGWDIIDVSYTNGVSNGFLTKVPTVARVLRLYERSNFAALEVGT
jgi:hypothetical protein